MYTRTSTTIHIHTHIDPSHAQRARPHTHIAGSLPLALTYLRHYSDVGKKFRSFFELNATIFSLKNVFKESQERLLRLGLKGAIEDGRGWVERGRSD